MIKKVMFFHNILTKEDSIPDLTIQDGKKTVAAANHTCNLITRGVCGWGLHLGETMWVFGIGQQPTGTMKCRAVPTAHQIQPITQKEQDFETYV